MTRLHSLLLIVLSQDRRLAHVALVWLWRFIIAEPTSASADLATSAVQAVQPSKTLKVCNIDLKVLELVGKLV